MKAKYPHKIRKSQMKEEIHSEQRQVISSASFAQLCMLAMGGDASGLKDAAYKLIRCGFCGTLVDPLDAIHEEAKGLAACAECGEIWMFPADDFNDIQKLQTSKAIVIRASYSGSRNLNSV